MKQTIHNRITAKNPFTRSHMYPRDKRGNSHVLSLQETAWSSQSVANVLAVPVASKAHTGPMAWAAQRPAHSRGGTSSRTRPRVSARSAGPAGTPPRSAGGSNDSSRSSRRLRWKGRVAADAWFHTGTGRREGSGGSRERYYPARQVIISWCIDCTFRF